MRTTATNKSPPASALCPVQLARDYRYKMPSIRVRPAGADEGAAYLRSPARFASCTVPVIWFPMWISNYAHVFRWGGGARRQTLCAVGSGAGAGQARFLSTSSSAC